jgi:hypothetical protein
MCVSFREKGFGGTQCGIFQKREFCWGQLLLLVRHPIFDIQDGLAAADAL